MKMVRIVTYKKYNSKIKTETIWHTPFHKPEIKKDSEINCSKSVLLYHPGYDVYSVGWFDFETDSWGHIGDEDFEDKFVWCELPKYFGQNGKIKPKIQFNQFNKNHPLKQPGNFPEQIRSQVYGKCVHDENLANCEECGKILKANKIT